MGLFPKEASSLPGPRPHPFSSGLCLPGPCLRPPSSSGLTAHLPAPPPGFLLPCVLQVPLSGLCPSRWPYLDEKSLTWPRSLGGEWMMHRYPPSFPQSWGFCIGDFSVSYFFLTFWSIKRAEAVVCGVAVPPPPGGSLIPAAGSPSTLCSHSTER